MSRMCYVVLATMNTRARGVSHTSQHSVYVRTVKVSFVRNLAYEKNVLRCSCYEDYKSLDTTVISRSMYVQRGQFRAQFVCAAAMQSACVIREELLNFIAY